MTRRSYNQAQADWWKAHPELVALRQLAGVDQADNSEEIIQDCDIDPEEAVTSYDKRRGE